MDRSKNTNLSFLFIWQFSKEKIPIIGKDLTDRSKICHRRQDRKQTLLDRSCNYVPIDDPDQILDEDEVEDWHEKEDNDQVEIGLL